MIDSLARSVVEKGRLYTFYNIPKEALDRINEKIQNYKQDSQVQSIYKKEDLSQEVSDK